MEADLPAALQLDVQAGEGLHTDHVVHDSCCIGVVCAIVELVYRARGILKALISLEGKKITAVQFSGSGILYACQEYPYLE